MFRFIIHTVFILLVLLAGFVGWLVSGSFEYQSSQEREFLINAPLSDVCRAALAIKEMPEPEEGEPQTKVDIQKAIKNVAIGEPIECEVEHPKLGKLLLKIQLGVQLEGTSVRLSGETISIEPSEIKQNGITVAELEKIQFTLGIVAKNGGAGSFLNLPTTGQTVIHFTSSTDLNVKFRDVNLIRSTVEREMVKSQEKVISQIEKFITTNFSEERLGLVKQSVEATEVEKPKKKGLLGNFFGNKKVEKAEKVEKVGKKISELKSELENVVNPLTIEYPSALPDSENEEVDVSILDNEL